MPFLFFTILYLSGTVIGILKRKKGKRKKKYSRKFLREESYMVKITFKDNK